MRGFIWTALLVLIFSLLGFLIACEEGKKDCNLSSRDECIKTCTDDFIQKYVVATPTTNQDGSVSCVAGIQLMDTANSELESCLYGCSVDNSCDPGCTNECDHEKCTFTAKPNISATYNSTDGLCHIDVSTSSVSIVYDTICANDCATQCE